MKIREFMALVEASATVKIKYTEIINYETGRMTRDRKTLRVPPAGIDAEKFAIYPFDSKEEIYNIDISMIDVGSDDEGEEVIFLDTHHIINKYKKY